jgi:hypothetical protein
MGIWPLLWGSEDSNTFWDQNIRKKHVIGPSQIRETLTLQIGGCRQSLTLKWQLKVVVPLPINGDYSGSNWMISPPLSVLSHKWS